MSKTLLIVDDEAHILSALRRSLRGQDLELLTASCAEEALSLMERQRVDAILCDHRMPGASGLDLLRIVASRRPDVRRSLLTGLPETIRPEEREALGVLQLIPKPWDRGALLRAVHSLLHGDGAP